MEALTHLRIYVEAAIDFPDEEIDFLSDGKIEAQLNNVIRSLMPYVPKRVRVACCAKG
ncbi:hypothetical protein ACNKHK_23980 [Shigella flexneri]